MMRGWKPKGETLTSAFKEPRWPSPDDEGMETQRPTFGHLGDGNLHVNIMYHRAIPAECRAAERAVQRLMETVVALGGAISGEHGIGLAKTPFLRLQHSPAQIRAMQAVKRALDPNGVLNPGKMFEVFEVWKHARLAVALPWDHK